MASSIFIELLLKYKHNIQYTDIYNKYTLFSVTMVAFQKKKQLYFHELVPVRHRIQAIKNATRNPQLCNFHISVSKDKRLKIDVPVAYCYINEFM